MRCFARVWGGVTGKWGNGWASGAWVCVKGTGIFTSTAAGCCLAYPIPSGSCRMAKLTATAEEQWIARAKQAVLAVWETRVGSTWRVGGLDDEI